MKILIARTAGFCMGVRRAVEMVLDAPGKHKTPIFTYGPLIHNPQVLNLLKERGITVINEIPPFDDNNISGERGTVLIRAHGVPPQIKTELQKAGFTVIDATCPRVIKVQTIIRKHADEGYDVIILGDKDHPEVIGLLGYACDKGHVVSSIRELESLPGFERAIIVAQTTQNTLVFEEVKAWAAGNSPHYKIFHTICDSTEKRQAEVKSLTESADALIVVGGYNSGNTQRLAEIGKQSGIPTYHIETEAELDAADIAAKQCVAITAGASTPNWIIRKVYRTVDTFSYSRIQSWRCILFLIQRTLLLTNIYVALGAGSLCYACMSLQKIPFKFSYVLISFLYILSMHILNNLTGMKADRYNDPDRASFYSAYKIFLTALAFIAGGAGLITAYTMGKGSFLILLVMSLMGLSYNLRIIPEFTGVRYRRIRDIPGSKTILIAAAWGVVTSLFPFLSVRGDIHLNTALVFTWSTGMVFVRTAFFDILDMQGDRIVGKDTIPLLMGEKQTMVLLKRMLITFILILTFSGTVNFTPVLGIPLSLSPLFMLIVLSAHEKGYMLPGIRLEFLIETHFVLAGIITFSWRMIGV